MYTVNDAADAEVRIAELVGAQNAGLARDVSYCDGRWLQVAPRSTSDGGTVLVCRDITERKLLEQRLEHMAMHDPLTDLPNRKVYHRELRRARARAERDGHRLALMLIDLDRFKEVNDTYGHQAGDQLLVEVARRLLACVRAGDVVARVGGDEFAVLAESAEGAEEFGALAARIVGQLGEGVRLDGIELQPGVSLGLSVFPDDPVGIDDFIVHADRALYAAKVAGGRTWKIFGERMAQDKRGAAGELDEASERDDATWTNSRSSRRSRSS
jgi:diguanylate cyclase (GGDEF)-like protein